MLMRIAVQNSDPLRRGVPQNRDDTRESDNRDGGCMNKRRIHK
jgi:hypothetical protein